MNPFDWDRTDQIVGFLCLALAAFAWRMVLGC